MSLSRIIDLTGQRFGFLRALELAGRDPKRGQVIWKCVCDCGREHFAKSSKLRYGSVRSCGCKHRELIGAATRKHGRSGTSEFVVWSGMLARCFNENQSRYHMYGGRGITVCERWRRDFAAFLADMGPRPSPQHSIDRIDNDGNYEPSNCRWVTQEVQANNTRSNASVSYNGRTQTIAQWSRETGIGSSTICLRLKLGWEVERVLTQPVDTRRSGRPKALKKQGWEG